ncbi:MAG: helix-turn-helix domain-containing protein [Candidatus Methanomethyliaceae archaeon]|nr:helix-turn-helix domain-containing protein [Candidatus Methanomethyliaceae archaeon]
MDEVLRNPHRRRILELLAQDKVSTPKEISEELKLGVPTVYYHLELLKGYVVKTSRGEFAITEKGLEIYKDSIKKEISSKSPVGRSVLYSVFSKIASSPRIFLLVSLVIGAIEFAICYYFYFLPYLLSYSRSIATEVLPFYYLGNIILIFAILEAFSLAVTRRLGGEISLLNSIMLSRIPLMFIMLDPIIGVSSQTLSIIILAVGQLISIFILSIGIALSKGIKQEISIIICLVILYLNIIIYTLQP